MLLISSVLLACSTPETPASAPAPQRAEPARPRPLPGPLKPPPAPVVDPIDADPMEIVASKGPDGEPAPAVSLLFASRGDGEIEPCG